MGGGVAKKRARRRRCNRRQPPRELRTRVRRAISELSITVFVLTRAVGTKYWTPVFGGCQSSCRTSSSSRTDERDGRLVGGCRLTTSDGPGDHGPFNSWDRVPYITTEATGKPSIIPAYRKITRNFILAVYSSQEAIALTRVARILTLLCLSRIDRCPPSCSSARRRTSTRIHTPVVYALRRRVVGANTFLR